MDRTYRFVCFAETSKVDSDKKSELLFWNEYADHFKGVRLKFVIDRDFSINPVPANAFVGKIAYKGHCATIEASKIQTIQDFAEQVTETKFLNGLCYSKSPNWASEYEVRIGSLFSQLLRCPTLPQKKSASSVSTPAVLKKCLLGMLLMRLT